MAFDNKKAEFSREKFEMVEIDLDYCSLTFGTGNCVGGEWRTPVVSITGTNDIGDEIQGGTSGAIAILTDGGATPWKFRITNGIQFTGSEIITNNTQTGSATKSGVLTRETLTDGKCYNTLTTCQDLVNFDDNLGTQTVKTYRICSSRSPLPTNLPTNLEPIPALKSASTSPAKIDIKGGLGVRSSLSLSMHDFPHNDVDIDKYVGDRTFDPLTIGSFGTKLRARNPEYQNRNIRYYIGYLEEGEYLSTNFQQRSYVIDKLNVSNGMISITAKDVLKLVSSKKAQAPAPTTGLTQGAMTNVATSVSVSSGQGAQYAASGHLLIDAEVMSFTRSTDTFTVVRGLFNTEAVAHASGVTIQECLYFAGNTVDDIVNTLLTDYSSIDSSFIPAAEWATNMSSFGNLQGIIVKPMDVNKLLIELTQAIPHYLWWDERGASPKIRMTPLEAPPVGATVYNMDESLIEDSVKLTDDTDSRVSTVFVNFGQFDPTKKLDEPANYQQSWVRVDADSIIKYGSNAVKTINSRWLNNTNLAGAKKVATLVGRRFADIQRKITFSLDDKDADGATGLWAGQSANVNHRDMLDFNGFPEDTLFQIISAAQKKHYDFEGIEFKYGQELADDIASTDKIVFYSAGSGNPYANINLKADWEALYGTHAADSEAIFIVSNNSVIGSSSAGTYAVETGAWGNLTTGFVKVIINSGSYVVGKGGDGGTSNGNGTVGGNAINLDVDVILEGGGDLGGGGGGGGGGQPSFIGAAGGGGGAGSVGGTGGNTFSGGSGNVTYYQSNGTVSAGGGGGRVDAVFGLAFARGGSGGNLGQNGTVGQSDDTVGTGGLAGKAVNLGGNTLDQTGSGVTVHGAVS